MGKKVNFAKDAINKHFESIEDLEEFMGSYASDCVKDLEFLENMHSFMRGDDDNEISQDELDAFIDKQKDEFEEFLKNKGVTLEEVEEFLMAQNADAKEFIENKFSNEKEENEDDDYEIDEDFKDAIKQVIREVLAEEKGK